MDQVETKKKKRLFFVEANISAGKSTLLRNLRANGHTVLDEPLDTWQNYYVDESTGENILEKFYSDMGRWSFDFQVVVMCTRYQRLVDAIESDAEVVILERSLHTDRYTFAESLHDSGHMSDLQWKIFLSWYKTFIHASRNVFRDTEINYIHLHTTPEECHRRMRIRDRTEEAGVPLDYLQKLNEKHQAWLRGASGDVPDEKVLDEKVHVVDGNQSEESVLRDVLRIIEE